MSKKAITSYDILASSPPWDMLFLKLILQLEVELVVEIVTILLSFPKPSPHLSFKTHSLVNNSKFLIAQSKPVL